MKLEAVKTFILTILIGTSLLLSLVIWNYQPPFDPLNPRYLGEVNIGGTEETKRSIIQPTSIVFHKGDHIYSFPDAKERESLYEKMQAWTLTEFSFVPPPNMNYYNDFVELSFPIDVPLNMIPSMFSIVEEAELTYWTFNRVLITFNNEYSLLEVYFLSTDGQHAVQFVVNESDAYTHLTAVLNKTHRLEKYISFGSEQDPVYIPEQSITMKRRSMTIQHIDPALLVTALFDNPSLVSHTIGETTYNDGQREMTVLNSGRLMEFVNPIHHSKDYITFQDVIELSIANINEHKGWTNDYLLESFDSAANRLQYQMYYEGYPVYSHENYSIIEQIWANQLLYEYKRPLFRITNLLNSEPVELPSGEEIVKSIYENSNYKVENITDMRLGYRLIYEEASFSITLEPAWYLLYNGRWIELKMNQSDLLGKGGV